MKLKEMLVGLEGLKVKGDLEQEIQGIESNSKKIEKGFLFIAIKGFDVDGHQYIGGAIEKGATAVMVEEGCDLKALAIPEGITIVMARNTREALAICSSNFYGNPSRKFKLIGVTGTKGKTTTTFMIKEILEKAGKKVGLIGTIATYINGKKVKESDRTTPESLELQELFYKMAKEKVDYVVMEVSSQSLKLNRVYGCNFDYAIFTNFYKDHISLKEHSDMEDYFNSKLKLFSMTMRGFINADDFKCNRIKSNSPKCTFSTYSIDNNSDYLAKDITITNISVEVKVKIQGKNERVKVNIPGRYSVYNALSAIALADAIGIKIEKIKEGLENITVPGRNELVPNNKELAIMIDYAHTAESLSNILQAVKTYTKGKVICVFGCGGDRDKTKRPQMGEVAGRIADYSIVTSDNPRTEAPIEIINEIEDGIKKTKGKYEIIENRKEAIKKAIEMMTKKDIVILAGKGHETYQEINGEKLPFDEREIVKEFLKEKNK